MTDLDKARRVRDALRTAGYTTAGVAELLGPIAAGALSRGETVPARRATMGGTALETLVRLFMLQLTVPTTAAEAALPPDAQELGLITADHDGARAALDVRPHGDESDETPAWWVVSDLRADLDGKTSRLPDDHVVGVGGASTMLAQLTPRQRASTTVDIGTGCGVQALHASRHSDRVIGTDVSARALRLARLSTALSDVEVDFREGNLLEPLAGQQVDLIVSNPPFVISPAGTHTYRDSGLSLDGVCANLVGNAPQQLTPGGDLVLLANWLHIGGSDWRERVGGWLPDTGVDALVVQREVLDPTEYIAMWLRDSGQTDDLVAYDGWLQAFEQARVEGVGMGFVRIRRTDEATRPVLLDWPHPVEQPLGPHLSAWLDRRAWLAGCTDGELLAATLRVARDVVQEQVGQPGAEDPEHVVLRRLGGLRPAMRVDTATAALVGASEGSVTVTALIAAVASVLEEDPGELARRLIPTLRDLVDQGVLEPG